MSLEQKIKEANQKLRTGGTLVTIERRDKYLWLRGTLPPKPHLDRKDSYQQRFSLGKRAIATEAGLRYAVAQAKIVSGQLIEGTFKWGDWIDLEKVAPDPVVDRGTVGEWLSRFEREHWEKTARNQQTETTWKKDYLVVFNKLPPDVVLTIDILLTRVRCTEPNTRSRKRACDYCFKLADFAGLEGRQKIKEFTGSYSAAAVNPRTLPNDSAIALFRNSIESPSWQWVVGVMAAYGLRNHEVFRLDMRDFPVARVTEGKTGDRFVYPLYPEWAQEWKLQDVILPALSLEYSNAKLGTKVSGWFYDHKAPFRAYDLRHAWARRAFEFRLSVNEAAKMLGHSQKVHTTTYQAWIDEEVYLKSIKSIIGRDDRPLPPKC